MRKLQRLKHLLWHVCHFHSPTCSTVTESVVASSREEAIIRVFGTMPPAYMPLVIWSEPIRRTA
jgi:hypothetical protein